MKNRAVGTDLARWTTTVAALVVAASLWAPAARAQGTADAERAVKATVHAFHGALAAGDSARALELLHPDLRVFENGHAETYSEYRGGHLGADMEFAAGTDRTVSSEQVVLGEGGALYMSESRASGTFRSREVDSRGTETMVLVRTGEGWRIRHIHWSSR